MAKTKKSKDYETTAENNTPLKTLEKLYRNGYDISNEKEILKLQISAFRCINEKKWKIMIIWIICKKALKNEHC